MNLDIAKSSSHPFFLDDDSDGLEDTNKSQIKTYYQMETDPSAPNGIRESGTEHTHEWTISWWLALSIILGLCFVIVYFYYMSKMNRTQFDTCVSLIETVSQPRTYFHHHPSTPTILYSPTTKSTISPDSPSSVSLSS